jgi:hypothetical protein
MYVDTQVVQDLRFYVIREQVELLVDARRGIKMKIEFDVTFCAECPFSVIEMQRVGLSHQRVLACGKIWGHADKAFSIHRRIDGDRVPEWCPYRETTPVPVKKAGDAPGKIRVETFEREKK